jgi:putative methyltransferase (TIGR04325 family)
MAKRWLPPVVVEWLQQTLQTIRFGAPEWEYVPDGWSTKDDNKVKGWNIQTVPDTQKAKWAEFVRATQGAGPLGIAHEAPSPSDNNYYAHHLVMAYAYVLALAVRSKDRLSLLDWGGGIGHYLIFSRCLIPDLDIEYCCKDLPLLCRAGREVLPEVQFIEREEEVATRRYDLVLASGSLQCSEDWKSVTRLLASCANPYLYVTRLPVVRRCKSFVALQRVHAYGYDTEYMCWLLNREEFLDHMASLDLELVREFVFHKHPMVKRAQEQAEIQGFLFRTKQ